MAKRASKTTVLTVFDGGPLDDEERHIDAGKSEIWITSEDGARHLYERVHTERLFPDGRRAVILRWRGRDRR